MKVAVWMVTYNHEDYIIQAIESVMIQETNFKYKLFIGEDCSTDNTRKICINLKEKYPDKIELFFQNINLGANKNAQQIYKACFESGAKYVAMLEGDDYWTDPLKLQKQVDFLEANEDYVIHSGDAIFLSKDYDSNGERIVNNSIDANFQLEDFLANNNLITCTVMFRNIKFKFPTDFDKVTFGDWFLYVILIKNSGGKVYRSTELLSVYRIHSGGIMSNLSKLKNYEAYIFQIITIHKYLKIIRLSQSVVKRLNNFYLQKFRIEVKNRSYINIIKTPFSNLKNTSSIYLRKYLSALKQEFLIL